MEYAWLLPTVTLNFASSVRLRPNLDAHICSILTSLNLNPDEIPPSLYYIRDLNNQYNILPLKLKQKDYNIQVFLI
jgi:hypothetical protein